MVYTYKKPIGIINGVKTDESNREMLVNFTRLPQQLIYAEKAVLEAQQRVTDIQADITGFALVN